HAKLFQRTNHLFVHESNALDDWPRSAFLQKRPLEVVDRGQKLPQETLPAAILRLRRVFLGALLEIFEIGGGAEQPIVDFFFFALELFDLGVERGHGVDGIGHPFGTRALGRSWLWDRRRVGLDLDRLVGRVRIYLSVT